MNKSSEKVMTVKELRAELEGLPDDFPVRFSQVDVYDPEYEVTEAFALYSPDAGRTVLMLVGAETESEDN